jgi:crossover junction endodeoxyribonuclease RusA
MISIKLTGRPLSINHLYRASARGGRPFQYMTAEGKNAKLAWGLTAQAQMRAQGAEIFKDERLLVTVDFFFENKAKRDLDNYLKALLDCMSGVVWTDDSQIWRLVLQKHIALDDEVPRTEIYISEN